MPICQAVEAIEMAFIWVRGYSNIVLNLYAGALNSCIIHLVDKVYRNGSSSDLLLQNEITCLRLQLLCLVILECELVLTRCGIDKVIWYWFIDSY